MAVDTSTNNPDALKDIEKGKDTATSNPDQPPPTASNEPFSVYAKKHKVAIIFAASVASFFSPMGANIYLPAINSVAADLHVSNTLINLTLSTYLIFQGLAPTFIGGFSDSAGRRPAYIICLVIYLGANVGLALQRDYVALLILRCVQACGSSGTVALANAVAADIVTSAERGQYIGYTSVGAILAPTLAPFLGGVLSQYAGWRWIFWFLVIFALSFFTPFLLFFPETCRRIVGNGSIPPPNLNHSLPSYLRERRLKKEGKADFFAERDRRLKERNIRFPNPVGTLKIIFDKTAGLTLLGNGLLFSCYYAVTASLPSQFRLKYGLNDFQIALIFLPFGVGGVLSAFTTGRIIDWNYRRHARRLGMPVERNRQADLSNFPIERARLEIAIPVILIGGAALLAYGWLIWANVSIAGPCVILFLVGYSITAGFNCMNILLVDMYPGKPATATAANNLVRCWLGAGSSAASVPLIDAIGIGWAATVATAIWVGYTPVLLIIMKNGPRWRREAKEAMEKKKRVEQEQEQSSKEIPSKESDQQAVQLVDNAGNSIGVEDKKDKMNKGFSLTKL